MKEPVVQVLDLKYHFPKFALGHGVHVLELTAAHAVYDGVFSSVLNIALIDAFAVSKDLHTVSYGEDLVQLMGDVYDALALGLELADYVHELVGLLLVERRCRLIHDYDLEVLGIGAAYFHKLLFRGG